MDEVKYCTVREWYLRMLIGKALKYDILMDENSDIDIDCDDFYSELYRGLTGEELPISNEQSNYIGRVNLVYGEITKQTDEIIERLNNIAKKDGFK